MKPLIFLTAIALSLSIFAQKPLVINSENLSVLNEIINAINGINKKIAAVLF